MTTAACWGCTMAVRRPASEDLQAIARQFHFTIPDGRMASVQALLEGFLAPYDRLGQLQEPGQEPRYPRDGGAAPRPEENPLGAWAWRVRIQGAAGGLLAGRTIAIKDNVAVAGVPMRNGTVLLDGYVPDQDATVVERVLDAGATILGKAVCESLCFSGGSHTADSGPVRNPYDPIRSTGGSSTGSAALVAAGEVDLAIGGDQGGSVRIPSCWSGIYGLKPTWGLVPYTGAFPIEASLDHLGPMARSSRDVALLLSVLAGPDGLDPRQHAGLQPADYLAALGGDVAGLRLGIVREGFGHQGWSTPTPKAGAPAATGSPRPSSSPSWRVAGWPRPTTAATTPSRRTSPAPPAPPTTRRSAPRTCSSCRPCRSRRRPCPRPTPRWRRPWRVPWR